MKGLQLYSISHGNSQISSTVESEMANMGLSDNPTNLNLERNSKKKLVDEESVAPLLFYYLVSL